MSSSESEEFEFEIVNDKNYQKPKVKKTTPYMSQYEYCALISARAGFITNTGEVSDFETQGTFDPAVIAKKEVDDHMGTLIIRRRFPDGTSEDWRPKDMIFPRV
jgi:DNA-directed RNA polymerase subunit K/omega